MPLHSRNNRMRGNWVRIPDRGVRRVDFRCRLVWTAAPFDASMPTESFDPRAQRDTVRCHARGHAERSMGIAAAWLIVGVRSLDRSCAILESQVRDP